jgi:hypothetical protein
MRKDAEMSKAGSDAGVGRAVPLIAFDYSEASDTASPPEGDSARPSDAARPAGQRRPRKRKQHSLFRRAEEALGVKSEALEGLKLRPHPERPCIAATDEGFDLPGFRYFRDDRGVTQLHGDYLKGLLSLLRPLRAS